MCGRYTQHHTGAEISERFELRELPLDMEPRFNVAPTQTVPVIREEAREEGARVLQGMKWGLVPPWAKDPSIGSRLINARGETLVEKPAFRQALKQRRCLIPADGFFEWVKMGAAKQPMHIRRRDGELFAFAGLWEEWRAPDGSPLRTCTIVTVAANELVAPIHDRMPAMLLPEYEALWLDPGVTDAERVLPVLRPYPAGEMEAYPVSTRVNKAGVNDPDLVRRAEARSLFDDSREARDAGTPNSA